MAIPRELASYESEDDFIQRLLIPLLKRLGFSVVYQERAAAIDSAAAKTLGELGPITGM